MEQPCGRDPWPILGGVQGSIDKPAYAIVPHLGPIETPAADLISHCLTLSAELTYGPRPKIETAKKELSLPKLKDSSRLKNVALFAQPPPPLPEGMEFREHGGTE